MVGLCGCVAPEAPPVVFADSAWRTGYGAPISLGELDALRQSCLPRQIAAPIDPARPVPNPVRDNPAYHPGGEGLANAPPTGIAAADRPIEPATRLSAGPGAGPVEECLYGKGLIKAR